jgi:hypothetical protein
MNKGMSAGACANGLAGIDRHDDAGGLFHRDRDVAGVDVRRLFHLPQLTVPVRRDGWNTMDDSVAGTDFQRTAGAPAIRGFEPDGKGGCCEASEMFKGRPGCSRNEGKAPGVILSGRESNFRIAAGHGVVRHGAGIGR